MWDRVVNGCFTWLFVADSEVVLKVCVLGKQRYRLELGNSFDAFVTPAALLASSRPLWGKDRPESTLNPKPVYALSRKRGGRPYGASAEQHPKP